MTEDTARQRQAIGRERAAFRKAVLYSDLSAGAVMMATAYESFAGNGLDRVWVSDEVLARLTRQSSVNTRKKHRAELVAAGVLVLIEPGNSRGTSPVYALRYRQLLTRGTAQDAQDASDGTSTFDSEPSNFDAGTVKNWSPSSKGNSKGGKEQVPSAPAFGGNRAERGDDDRARIIAADEITALAGEPANKEDALWRKRIIDQVLVAGDEWAAAKAAGDMLARGEHPARVEATICATNYNRGITENQDQNRQREGVSR